MKQKLDYKFRRTLNRKVYTSPNEYYGAVYEDLVKYGVVSEDKIRSDKDLKEFLDKDVKTRSENLFERLKKTSYHKEVINRNLPEDKYMLKNKKVVDIKGKVKVRGVETYYYSQMLIISGKERTSYRDIKTGRFVSIK